MTKSFDLVFKFGLHAQFINVDLVKNFKEFCNQLLLTNVLVLAIAISCSRTAVINVMRHHKDEIEKILHDINFDVVYFEQFKPGKHNYLNIIALNRKQ